MANGTVAASQIEMLSQSGTGITTIVPPATNTNRTLTLPDNTGTVLTTSSTFAGTGPAFSAYQSTQQTGISVGTFTKVNLQTEEFDTASCFDTSTATFTPNVAGYYQVNCTAWGASPSGSTMVTGFVSLWKNNAWIKDGSIHTTVGNAQVEFGSTLSVLVYMYGTNDYLHMYIWGNTTSGTFNVYGSFQQQRNHFSSTLVRAA